MSSPNNARFVTPPQYAQPAYPPYQTVMMQPNYRPQFYPVPLQQQQYFQQSNPYYQPPYMPSAEASTPVTPAKRKILKIEDPSGAPIDLQTSTPSAPATAPSAPIAAAVVTSQAPVQAAPTTHSPAAAAQPVPVAVEAKPAEPAAPAPAKEVVDLPAKEVAAVPAEVKPAASSTELSVPVVESLPTPADTESAPASDIDAESDDVSFDATPEPSVPSTPVVLEPATLYDLLVNNKHYNVPPPGFTPPYDIRRPDGSKPGNSGSQDARSVPVNQSSSRGGGRGGMGSRQSSQSDTRQNRPQQSPAGGKMQRTPSNRGQNQNSQLTIPQSQLKPLEKSATRWVAASRSAAQVDEDDKLFKKMRGLLNKLTADNFDPLAEEVKGYKIDTTHLLKGVIKVVFQKALDEPKFGPFYAKMALVIQTTFKDDYDEELVDGDGNPKTQKTNFRRLLLNQCQELFENKEKHFSTENLTAEEKATKTQAELEELEYLRLKAKRHMLGNITFIGELFKLQMITPKIIFFCMKELLENGMNPEESDVECFFNLLKNVGKIIDNLPVSDPKAGMDSKKHMDVYFDRVLRMSALPNINSRTKFMLLDLLDLRKNHWLPRRAEDKIQKIEDVRNQVEMEKQRASASGRSDRGSDRRSSGKQNMPNIKDQHSDFSRLASRGETKGGDLNTFAPNKFQRAADNKKPPAPQQQAPPAPTTTSNLFSVLELDSTPSKSNDGVDASTESSPSKPPADEPKKITAEAFEKRIDSLLVEFKGHKNVKEFIISLEDLDASEHHDKLIEKIFDKFVSAKASELGPAVKLVGTLLEEKFVSQDGFVEGLGPILGALDDFDEPIVDGFSADLIHAALQNGFSYDLLNKFEKNLSSQKIASKVVASLLNSILGSERTPESEQKLLSDLKDAKVDLFAITKASFNDDKAKCSDWLKSKNFVFLDAAV